MIYKIFYPKSTSFVLIKFSITENITGSRSMKIWKVQTMYHVITICVSQLSMKIKINGHSTGILKIDKITINKLTAPVSSIWDDILPLSILKRKEYRFDILHIDFYRWAAGRYVKFYGLIRNSTTVQIYPLSLSWILKSAKKNPTSLTMI